MSIVYNGEIINTEASQNAMGGTEMMRSRLIRYVAPELLNDVAIHFSRTDGPIDNAINVFYAHDLAHDPANKVLVKGGWQEFDHFVFVSQWQRAEYMLIYGIPQEYTTVIQNAILTPIAYPMREADGIKRFIYHTTPHRGLELLVPIFDQLASEYGKDVHLDVFSSFSIYGWPERDKPYENLFKHIMDHKHMTYHGARPNHEVLKALHNSDYFLYPCIWKETSCIAMIEAMAHNVLTIHPDLAALPETGSYGPTVQYDWTPDPNEHMNRAYSATKQVLEAPDFQINRYVAESFTPKSAILNVNHFSERWSLLLGRLQQELFEEDVA